MVKRISANLIDRFRRVESAAISDAMEPWACALEAEIKSVVGKVKIAGPALTVRCYPGDELTLLKSVELAKRGDVIVADCRGVTQSAYGGGIVFGYAWRRGVEGIVIDGTTRDTEEYKSYPIAVFARGTISASAVSASMGEINSSIECGGVVVNPGDVVIGDSDGVVVVPRERAEDILEIAEKISAMDADSIKWIKANVSIDEIKERRRERSEKIKRLKLKLLGRRLETHW